MTSEPANMQAMLATQFSVRHHSNTWAKHIFSLGDFAHALHIEYGSS